MDDIQLYIDIPIGNFSVEITVADTYEVLIS